MYRNFFSLSDLPFSISPDPKYLFMSERHKEALSHLTYGLGEVGGFALLTGEVGTGKTTISRCLMEQLPVNTQAAFILNPTLSSQELLATLCDELHIDYEKSDESLKHLTDIIAEKLLENHKNDINTLLIIDEAQHLQPEVLEQLRLLTNLETNTKKLLQVILIGQPELQQLLQRRDLRQLAQRITARYHLMPLTLAELTQYIEHRLTVADCVRPLFDKGAISKIHQLSQGVPRIINLLCHSALMQAYNQNDSVVSKKIVMVAAEKTLGSDLKSAHGEAKYHRTLLISTAVSAAAFIALAGFWLGQSQEPEIVIINPAEELKDNQSIAVNSATSNKQSTNVSNKAINKLTTNQQNQDSTQYSAQHLTNNSTQMSNINPSAAVNVDQVPELIKQQHLAPNGLYTVQYGDTLFKLSVQFNIKLNSLRQWNNIYENDSIAIGDKLYVVEPENISYTQDSTKKTNNYSSQGSSQPNNSQNSERNSHQDDTTRFVSAEKPNRTVINNRNTPKRGDIKYQVKPVEGVSSDLLALFQEAIDETEPELNEGNSTQSQDSNGYSNSSADGSSKEQLNNYQSQTQSSNTGKPSTTKQNDNNETVTVDGYKILPLSQMPKRLQDDLPSLKFEQHVYTSDKKGWVSESGSNYYEGDFITDRLKLDKILPQKVILTFEGQTFSMPALTSW
ncbi:AAA family ATPase [Colwellia echini]|uniref:AAA family ATPase n=1 Tax=Colwellia echini TaxID=1982103 RepID=A0ABY3N1U5_9GAMM|nr:AAA family ATPase [Colwellia echini]TYK67403.1 AAA family ATPase [Colwellia echini]